MSVARLEALLEERLGLVCADWQRARLAELDALHHHRASGAARPAGPEAEDVPLSPAELQDLIEQVIIGETYFFREPAHLTILVQTALRERLQQREPGWPVRILCIGCSSGEEVYSVAMALSDHHADFATGHITLDGIDVSAAAIRKARRAHYSAWALRATPPALRAQWFKADGENYQLREEIRSLAAFEQRNLLDNDPGFWHPGGFDIIFCRNVLIYFSDRSLRLAVARLSHALAPGGFLFLGHSETLRGISDDFEHCHSADAFFYRKKPVPAPPRPLPPPHPGGGAELEPAPVPSLWYDAIRRSTERVNRLTSTRTPISSSAAAPAEVRPPEPSELWVALGPAMQRIAGEQFEQALELLAKLPAAVAQSGAAMLLAATSLCGQGRHAESRQTCLRLLVGGHHSAEAHYLLGLCHENAGDKERAQKDHQEATRADPRFAMAHVHLGILLRRLGQRELARSTLRQALELLPHERPERVLLFGGGFQREALLALCRAELVALGVE